MKKIININKKYTRLLEKIIFFAIISTVLTMCPYFLNKIYGKTLPVKNKKATILYQKALNYYKIGKLSAALSTIKFTLNNYSANKITSSNIYYLYGNILYKLNDFFIAKPYFQRIINENPNYTHIVKVIFMMAKCDFNLKNYRRSIRDFNFLIKRTKMGVKLHDESLIYLTLSYAASGKMDDADKLFNEDNVEKILQKITYLEKQDKYFKLVYMNYLINYRHNLYAALLMLNNKNLFYPKKDYYCYSSYFEGIIALRIGKYSMAQTYFMNSSKYCSDYYYHGSLLYYGIALTKQNNPKGLKYINGESSDINYPKIKLSALKFLAAYYKKNKKYEKRLAYLKRLLFSYQLSHKETILYQKYAANLLFTIVKTMYKNNDFKNPFKITKTIAFLIPNKFINPEIYWYLAKIKLKENDLKSTLPLAEKYYALSGSANSKLFLANVYYENGKYKKSLSLINMISSKNAKADRIRDDIVNLRLELYRKLNYTNEVVSLLKQNLNILPPKERMKNIYFLALYEFNQNRARKALFYFDSIIKSGHSAKQDYAILYDTYYYLGLINYRFHNYRTSLLYFKKGYALKKSGAHFQYELSQIAYLYMKYLNNNVLALKYYNKLNENATSETYKNIASSMINAIDINISAQK